MIKILIALVFTILSTTSYCQNTDATSIKLTEELEKIYARKHIIGFSVAIVNQDRILYEEGFGYSDRNANKKYTNTTVQNIASISKTLIGIALLKAQELGKLNLDDPINQYLPFDVKNPYHPNEPITIRQLATHTSSIKDPSRYEKNGYILKDKENDGANVNRNFRSPDEKIAQEEFLKNMLSEDGNWYKKNTFLKTKPGEIFEYSNVAAGLAALLIEKATNQSFNEFTNNYILQPLGIQDSGWSFNEIDFSNHSKLYLNEETEVAFYELVNYPDGGFITSAHDLGRYLVELISGYNGNGKILTQESYTMLFTPYLTEKHFKDRNESIYNDEYNMGVFMGISAKGQIGHTGGDPGVATHMFFNSTTQKGKLLIVNTDLEKEGIQEFIDIWKALEAYETKL